MQLHYCRYSRLFFTSCIRSASYLAGHRTSEKVGCPDKYAVDSFLQSERKYPTKGESF